ncbi:MAG: TldD/PmbA family protein [Acidilobaceae archaeon]
MIDPQVLAENASRKLSNLVDEYVVNANIVSSVMVKYADGEVTVTQSWKDYVLDVYVSKNSKINTSTYTTHDPIEVLSKLPSLIEKLTASPLYTPLPEPTGSPLSIIDSRLKDSSLSGDISGLLGSIDVKSYGNVAGMIEVSYSRSHYIGSNGLDSGFEITEFNGYFRVFRGDDSGQWAWVSTFYDESLARGALDKASSLAELCSSLPKENIETGYYRVLLSPMVSGNLLESVARFSTAGSVILGFSFLQGKKAGDIIASEKLTLREVPRNNRLPNYRGFDDEGVATMDKPIIERGVFKGFLHNSKTAKLMNEKTTGNAGWILPRIFNLEVEPGDIRESELLEALGDGLYATNNWYTRFQNFLEGTFSTVTRDALLIVRRGKPIACSRRARLAGSLPEMLSSIEDLSRERWQIKWWEVRVPIILPHMLIKKITVTSTTL